jgi:hypothetical protein
VSSPLERLEAIVANVRVSKVKFVGSIEGKRILMSPVKISNFELLPSEDKLQELLRHRISEGFDYTTARYKTDVDALQLYRHIQDNIIQEYSAASARCKATQRKTEDFIRGIKLDNSQLANYLVAIFIELNSESWKTKSRDARRIYLDTFEALRRTYGSK